MKRRLFILVSALCLLLSLGISVFHPGTAAADAQSDLQGATNFVFYDQADIVGTLGSSGQLDFNDTNFNGDSNHNYAPLSIPSGMCNPPSKWSVGITLTNADGSAATTSPNYSAVTIPAHLSMGYLVNNNCVGVEQTISILNSASPTQSAGDTLQWDGNNITSLTGQKTQAIMQPSATVPGLYEELTTGCGGKGVVLLNSGSTTSGTYYFLETLGTDFNDKPLSQYPDIKSDFPANCLVHTAVPTSIAGTQGQPSNIPGASSANGTTTGGGPPTCESSSNGFNLSWMFCGIINGLVDATDAIYNTVIQPLLVTRPVDLTSDSPSNTYRVWSTFRVYGDIFLVIALLVVVFGESIGGGLIDAYSARKILPRLLIAAILINLSLYIVAVAVDLTNILGNGLGALIEAPFKSAEAAQGAFSIHISGGTGTLGIGAVAAALYAATHLGAPLVEFMLLFLLIPAILTFLAIMVTVIVRRGLILLLIFVSPVAFALYCLPNTEKYFRQWWDLLLRTLLVYPLIAVFFAMGNVLSVTMDSTSNAFGVKEIADFVSLAALFVPLFLIPFSFRIAGGILGRVHDLATNARQRAHQGILGSEQDQESWRNRTRNKLAMRRVEQNLDGKSLPTRLNPLGFRDTAARQSRLAERRAAGAARLGARFAESDSIISANQGNDAYLLAAADRGLAKRKLDKVQADLAKAQKTYDNLDPETSSEERDKLRKDMAGYQADITTRKQAIAAASLVPYSQATRMQAAQALAQTGFQFADGYEGYEQLATMMSGITGAQLERDPTTNKIVGASGVNEGLYAKAMNNAQYGLRNGGRFDLGGINGGAGYSFESGIDKANGYTAGQAKPATFTAGAESMLGVQLKEGGETGKVEDIAQRVHSGLLDGTVKAEDVVKWHGVLLDAEQNPTTKNRGEIRKQLQALDVVRGSTDATTAGGAPLPAALSSVASGMKENISRQRRGIDPNLIEGGVLGGPQQPGT